jgi:hypothetical protein
MNTSSPVLASAFEAKGKVWPSLRSAVADQQQHIRHKDRQMHLLAACLCRVKPTLYPILSHFWLLAVDRKEKEEKDGWL